MGSRESITMLLTANILRIILKTLVIRVAHEMTLSITSMECGWLAQAGLPGLWCRELNPEKQSHQPSGELAPGLICAPGDFNLVTQGRALQAHRGTSAVISCTFLSVYISFQEQFCLLTLALHKARHPESHRLRTGKSIRAVISASPL